MEKWRTIFLGTNLKKNNTVFSKNDLLKVFDDYFYEWLRSELNELINSSFTAKELYLKEIENSLSYFLYDMNHIWKFRFWPMFYVNFFDDEKKIDLFLSSLRELLYNLDLNSIPNIANDSSVITAYLEWWSINYRFDYVIDTKTLKKQTIYSLMKKFEDKNKIKEKVRVEEFKRLNDWFDFYFKLIISYTDRTIADLDSGKKILDLIYPLNEYVDKYSLEFIEIMWLINFYKIKDLLLYSKNNIVSWTMLKYAKLKWIKDIKKYLLELNNSVNNSIKKVVNKEFSM